VAYQCVDRRDLGYRWADARFFDAPYAAHHGWICLYADGLIDARELKELLHDSYRLVALKRMLTALADLRGTQ
jgi:predicted DNA-binding protein (MmcQ/YjbR family)